MRYQLTAWWCGACKTKNTSTDRVCGHCSNRLAERNAQVSQGERAVVYYNRATGEHRTPPRADMEMAPQYARAGFERKEIMSMTQWEREANVVHEASSFHPGNEPMETPLGAPTVSKEAREALIRDMADAIASGPFTGADNLLDTPPEV